MEDLLYDLRKLGYDLVRISNSSAFYVYTVSGEKSCCVSCIFFSCALRHGYSYAVHYNEITSTLIVRFKLL